MNTHDDIISVQAGGETLTFPSGTSQEVIDRVVSQQGAPSAPAMEGEVVPQQGAQQEAPEEAPNDEQLDYIPWAPVRESVSPSELNQDTDWLEAAEVVHKNRYGHYFNGSDEELNDWARGHMAWWNYNLTSKTLNASRIMNSDQDTKRAFLFMMDTFDNTDISGQGVWNATKAMAADPTVYAGVGSLGLGLIGRQGVRKGAKETLRYSLKRSLGRSGIIGGAEGAAYGYWDNRQNQNIEVYAGRKEERDKGESATATAIGGTAGVILGTGIDFAMDRVVRLLPSNWTRRNLPDEPPQIRREGGEDDVFRDPYPMRTTEEGGTFPDPNAPTRTVGDIEVPRVPGAEPTRRTMQENVEFASDIARQLDDVDAVDVERVVQELSIGEYTLNEVRDLGQGTQMARDNLTIRLADTVRRMEDPPEGMFPRLIGERDELIRQQQNVEKLDGAIRSQLGLGLRQRKEGITDFNDLSYERLREQGVAEEDLDAVFLQNAERILRERPARKLESHYDQQIQKAVKDGKLVHAMELSLEKRRELDGLLPQYEGKSMSWFHKASEFSVSNVFSPTTLMINLIPSATKGLVIPAARFMLNNPFDKATRVRASQTYSAMRAAQGHALRGARASWRWEQQVASRDPNRFFESSPAMGGNKVSGRVAPLIRSIVRGIGATDEYLTRINYDGHVAGEAAAEAAEQGIQRGLRGKELDDHINQEVTNALNVAYENHNMELLLEPIRIKGENLGYKGEQLLSYIRSEFKRDPEILKMGNDTKAMDYVRDVLYKQKFEKKGIFSTASANMDDLFSKNPSLKLAVGQLFLRTPLRVMEEAARITPVLNMPLIMSDLSGKNGAEREIKARAQAAFSFAILGTATMLYAEGRISGDGNYNHWQQGVHDRESKALDPYHIEMKDGSVWNYRYFDPLATPLKITVNALERIDHLQMRRAQGEDVPENFFDEAYQAVTIAQASVIRAVRDANLLTGFDNAYKALEAMSENEPDDSFWLRWTSERMRWLLPSTLHKYTLTNDPEYQDPATLLQAAESNLLKPVGDLVAWESDIKTSKAYGPLGQVRTHTNIGGLWNLLATAPPEARMKERTPQQTYVDEQITRLQDQTDLVLQLPMTRPDTGDWDLRTIVTGDGEETMIDRWNRLYREQVDYDALEEALRSNAPEGTFGNVALKGQMVRELSNTFRDIAWQQLLDQEPKLRERREEIMNRDIEVQMGDHDYPANTNTLRTRPQEVWSNTQQ